uniref:Ig-like domain-containing protein n=1 Tax=Salarias fasciatus TaxID=181472 RepID=A0A672F8M9_SALFA
NNPFLTIILAITRLPHVHIGSVQENILAAEGQDATLPCKAPKNKTKNISIVLWTKPDLGEDNYVLLYRNGKVNPDKHHFFKNRVDLKDRTINDGDVSLILKNVTFKDSGTYQCFIDQIEQNKVWRKDSSSSSSSTSLCFCLQETQKDKKGMEDMLV